MMSTESTWIPRAIGTFLRKQLRDERHKSVFVRKHHTQVPILTNKNLHKLSAYRQLSYICSSQLKASLFLCVYTVIIKTAADDTGVNLDLRL